MSKEKKVVKEENKKDAKDVLKLSKEGIEISKKEYYATKRELELLEEQKKIKEEFKEIALKGAEVIQPKYRYERTPEYLNLKLRDLEFAYKEWYYKQYLPTKEMLENKLIGYKKILKYNGVRV